MSINLYDLASSIQPEQLADYESKIIYKVGRGRFFYLVKQDDAVYMRMSGSEAQLLFYVWEGDKWEQTTLENYKTAAEIWKDEIS